MKDRDLYSILGELDDELLSEAERAVPRKNVLVRALLAAAIVLLAAGLVVLGVFLAKAGNDNSFPPVDNTRQTLTQTPTQSPEPTNTAAQTPTQTVPFPTFSFAGTTVYIEVNPSIALELDEEGAVERAYGVNDDGSELLLGRDLSGLRAEEAVSTVVALCIDAGYLNAEHKVLTLSVIGQNDTASASLCIELVELVGKYFEVKLPGGEVVPQIVTSERSCIEGSVGLIMRRSSDGNGSSVAGIGLCTDTDVVIPVSSVWGRVTRIESGAFANCAQLTSVVVPMGVHSIGDGAFRNCSSLQNVYYRGSAKEWENVVVDGGNEPLLDAALTTCYDVHSSFWKTAFHYLIDEKTETWERYDAEVSYTNGLAVVTITKNDEVVHSFIAGGSECLEGVCFDYDREELALWVSTSNKGIYRVTFDGTSWTVDTKTDRPVGMGSIYDMEKTYVHPITSEHFSQEDLEAAVKVAVGRENDWFFRDTENVRILEIGYVGDDKNTTKCGYYDAEAGEWRTYDETIKLMGSFYVYDGSGVLNDNALYPDFSWTLGRSKGGEWIYVGCGY